MNKQSLFTILLTVLMSMTGAKAFAHVIPESVVYEVTSSGTYYFWMGTTKPTADNYTTNPGVVTAYNSLDEALAFSPSLIVTANQYGVVLCPSSWVLLDNVVFQDQTSGKIYALKTSSTNIENHKVYQTIEKISVATTIVLKKKSDAEAYLANLNSKCAAPTIILTGNKLSFSCTTEGAVIHYSISTPDVQSGVGSQEVSLTYTYTVSAYATKEGLVNSDMTTREIIITGTGEATVVGDVNKDGKVDVADHVKLSDIIMNKK